MEEDKQDGGGDEEEAKKEEEKEVWKPFHWADKVIDKGKHRVVEAKELINALWDEFIREYASKKLLEEPKEYKRFTVEYVSALMNSEFKEPK